MNCDELKPWLHGYADGELDLVRSLEIEHHLQGCPSCAAVLRQLQGLRQALGDGALYQRAPAGLRRRLRATLPRPAVADLAVRVLAVAASVALVAFLIWGAVNWLGTSHAEDGLAQAVVANHVRSLLVGKEPRVDIASSDRHEVKPWFIGRVAFSPVVRDFKAEGYPLIGGRLDYLDNLKVAALVYKHRKHSINLFTWPAPDAADEAPRAQTRQGFQVVHWRQNGMTYWAVSDLNEEELRAFADLLRH